MFSDLNKFWSIKIFYCLISEKNVLFSQKKALPFVACLLKFSSVPVVNSIYPERA